MSVLRAPEVSEKYGKHFIGVHADFSELQLDDDDPRHATIARFNPSKWRPVLVILDASGKEVLRHIGKLKDKSEALLLVRYISERHYLKTEWRVFRVAESN